MDARTTNMETHTTTTPNKKPPMAIDVFRENVESEKFFGSVLAYYGGNDKEASSFKMACIDHVRRVPKLLECDRVSLLSAFVTSAQFRFMPSQVYGECHIIPYGREAKFQLGYQGIVTLLYRSGKISSVTSNIIYENDTFEYQEGLDAYLKHVPAMFGKVKGDAIGVYTVVTMSDGTKSFKVLDRDAVMGIKAMSKAANSKESPWNSKDPELWMWRKTCLIQHAKLLPKTQEFQQAVEKDYEADAPNLLDAAGPATSTASHRPQTGDKSFDDKPSTPYNEPEGDN